LTPEQPGHQSNGIWLCEIHGRRVLTRTNGDRVQQSALEVVGRGLRHKKTASQQSGESEPIVTRWNRTAGVAGHKTNARPGKRAAIIEGEAPHTLARYAIVGGVPIFIVTRFAMAKPAGDCNDSAAHL
jgi:hypothetical protein